MNSSKLSYRAEIDGLRAIAVVSVILYHAQLVLFGRDWFGGGFIGVDIFFVISGYLITRIILSELESKGSFSFLNFYERRARRILPMLFVVIFVSIPFAWQKLLPSDFVEYAESILASLFFGSNFFFYFSTTEYGADSALLKPFLHTWSLGVEEQFYLVFPILAIVSFRYFRKHFLTILVGLSLLSIQFAELMELRNSDLNFYLPFSRFWELAVGSMLAYRELNYKPTNNGLASKSLPILGLYLIAYSILFFDGKTPHPSFHTLIPVIGVALIIGFASKDELVGKVLGSKPFVWTGLISYSAYLWHFPIFAFSRMGEEPTNYDKYEWITLTVILSVLSYFVVERPFRAEKIIASKMVFWFITICTFIVCAFGIYVTETKGVYERFAKQQQNLIEDFNVPEYSRFKHPLGLKGNLLDARTKSVNCYLRDPKDACRYGDERFVFLGDSFVAHYERAMSERLSERGIGFISFSYGLCPFVTDRIWFGTRPECSYVNEQRRKIIDNFSSKKIFLLSANEKLFQNPKKRTDDPIEDGWRGITEGEKASPKLAWDSYFENIRWLVSKGHKVILVRTLPSPSINSIKWLPQNRHYITRGFPSIQNKSKPSKISQIDSRTYPNFENSVVIVDPIDILCDSANDVCWDVVPNGPIFNSGRHLSYLGADLVSALIVDAVESIESSK